MAKKQQEDSNNNQGQGRRSRKQELIARKQERQLRVVYLIVAGILAMIGVVIAIALVNELIITPNQSVAIIGDNDILLQDWQDRVEYERAQRVIFLENQLEAFGGDVGVVQQFGGQVINDLFEGEGLGENTLDIMVDELVACRALEQRGIVITDEEVRAEIAAGYNYFDGQSPTPIPAPTETIAPTPSLTPIPTAVITDVVPTQVPLPTAILGPDPTPLPTATPVSEAYFDEQFGDLMVQFDDLGVDEATYLKVVRSQMCQERLAEELAEEQSLPLVAPHASVFFLSFETEEEANEALASIGDGEYLEVWNTIRSQLPSDDEEDLSTARAFEILSRTRENLESGQGLDVAAAAFALDTGEVSEVIPVTSADGTVVYYIIMVSGREERELAPNEYDLRLQELVTSFVNEELTGKLQINELWRSRVPALPILDSKFLAPPTPAPDAEPVDSPGAPEEGGE